MFRRDGTFHGSLHTFWPTHLVTRPAQWAALYTPTTCTQVYRNTMWVCTSSRLGWETELWLEGCPHPPTPLTMSVARKPVFLLRHPYTRSFPLVCVVEWMREGERERKRWCNGLGHKVKPYIPRKGSQKPAEKPMETSLCSLTHGTKMLHLDNYVIISTPASYRNICMHIYMQYMNSAHCTSLVRALLGWR